MCIKEKKLLLSETEYNQQMLELQRQYAAGQIDPDKRDEKVEKLMKCAGVFRRRSFDTKNTA